MYQLKSLRINELDNTISVEVTGSGYRRGNLKHDWEFDGFVPFIGDRHYVPNCLYLTIPFSNDPTVVANSIRSEIEKAQKGTEDEKSLFDQVRQLGNVVLEPRKVG